MTAVWQQLDGILAGSWSQGNVQDDIACLGVHAGYTNRVAAIHYGRWHDLLQFAIHLIFKNGCEAGDGNAAIIGTEDMHLQAT